MLKTPAFYALLLLLLAGILAIRSANPPAAVSDLAPDTVFSAVRAFNDLQAITKAPHPTGSAENASVREYIVDACREIGLQTSVQETMGYHYRAPRLVGGRVFNIIAVQPGTSPGKAVLVMAHYDSEPNASGAGDDGAGVAAMLETARILARGKQLKNDIIFLFTDGEEQGLLGAEAFVQQHPLLKSVGLVLNFEGRGNGGVSTMFEVNPDNGWVLREFAKAVPEPDANALSYEVYRNLPNDTDFSPFKKAGLTGLNHAFIEGLVNYHSITDRALALDPRSLQHHGNYMLSELRHFGNLDLTQTRAADVMYFNLPLVGMIVLPSSWNIGWVVLDGLLLLVLIVMGLKRKAITVTGVLATAGLYLLTMVALVFVTLAATKLIVKLNPSLTHFYEYSGYFPGYHFLAVTMVLVACTALIFRWLSKKWRLPTTSLGIQVVLFLLLVAMHVFAPTAIYLLSFPILFQLIALVVTTLRQAQEHSEFAALIHSLALLPAVVIFAPTLYFLFVAFGLGMQAPAIAIFFSMLAGLLLPLIYPYQKAMPKLLPIAAGITALGAMLGGQLHAGYSAEYPLQSSVWYELDADTQKALWHSQLAKADHWNAQFFSHPSIQPGPWGDTMEQEAPLSDLAPSIVTVLHDSTIQDTRVLDLKIEPALGSLHSLITLPEGETVRHLAINGVAVPGEDEYNYMLLAGSFAGGYVAHFETRSQGALKFSISDARPGLPVVEGLKPMPDDVIPGTGRRNNTSVVKKSYQF